MKSLYILKSYLLKRYHCKTILFFQDLLENVTLTLTVIFIDVEEYFPRFKKIDRIEFNLKVGDFCREFIDFAEVYLLQRFMYLYTYIQYPLMGKWIQCMRGEAA